jgi:L-lactate dehydrogenase
MKVGIVGAGQVGRACALALAARGCARYIVLVDRTRARAEAVATDIRYGLPLLPRAEISAGDYDDLAGSALVMITAGVNEKTGGATDAAIRRAGCDSSTKMPISTGSWCRAWCTPRRRL